MSDTVESGMPHTRNGWRCRNRYRIEKQLTKEKVMEQRQISNLYFEAGELLRKETETISESLANVLKSARPEDWATAARELIGRGDLEWMKRLIERLSQSQTHRLVSEKQLERIDQYIEEQRNPKVYI